MITISANHITGHTDRHTHTRRTDCSIWTTKVDGNYSNDMLRRQNCYTQGDSDVISSYQLFSAILWGKLC